MLSEFFKLKNASGKFILLLVFICFSQSKLLLCQIEISEEFKLAKANWLAANNQQAEEGFKAVVKRSKNLEILAQSYYYLADIHHARGDFLKAIEYDKKILEMDLPSSTPKHSNMNGDHLKHLACSTLADLHLSLNRFKDAIRYLNLELTDYSSEKSLVNFGPFKPPAMFKSFDAKRWADAYIGLGQYDSAAIALLPYAFGENPENRIVFEKFCEIISKAFSSVYAKSEVKKMLLSQPIIDKENKTIRITIFNKNLAIPNDESLRMYYISDETLNDFLINSNPIKYLLSIEW